MDGPCEAWLRAAAAAYGTSHPRDAHTASRLLTAVDSYIRVRLLVLHWCPYVAKYVAPPRAPRTRSCCCPPRADADAAAAEDDEEHGLVQHGSAAAM